MTTHYDLSHLRKLCGYSPTHIDLGKPPSGQLHRCAFGSEVSSLSLSTVANIFLLSLLISEAPIDRWRRPSVQLCHVTELN